MTTKFGLKKLETSLNCALQNVFRYVEPFRQGSQVWRTDRRTDERTTVNNSMVYWPALKNVS